MFFRCDFCLYAREQDGEGCSAEEIEPWEEYLASSVPPEKSLANMLFSGIVEKVVEAFPDGIFLVGESGKIIFANGRAAEIFGYDREEFSGQAIELLLPERLHGLHVAHRTRYAARPVVRPMSEREGLRGRRKNGREFPIEVNLSPVVHEGETYVVTTVRDITARLATEAAAREVKQALDATHEAVMMFAESSLQFSYVNEGAVQQLGYSSAELLEMTPLHIAPELTEDSLRSLLRTLGSGEVDSHTLVTTHRRKDGRDLPVELSVQCPFRDSPSPVFVVFSREVTDRLAAERERREGLERIRVLHHVASDLQIGSDEQFSVMLQTAAGLLKADAGIVGRIAYGTYTVQHWYGEKNLLSSAMMHPLDGTFCERVVETGEVVSGMRGDENGAWQGHPCFPAQRLHAYIGVPIEVSGRCYGTLDFCVFSPREEAWVEVDRDFLRLLGKWIGRTIERNETESVLIQARQAIAVGEDRERIGRDLHDTVIQDLFATGMSLQSIANKTGEAGVREEVEQAIDSLDGTIRRIRTTIFGLRHASVLDSGIREAILSMCTGYHSALGFEPAVNFDGPIETMPAEITAHLLPALREALANVAKHADATAVEVRVEVADELMLRVTDNGRGVSSEVNANASNGHGLRNLLGRAVDLGGVFNLTSAPGKGTVIEWRVPLKQPPRSPLPKGFVVG